MKTLYCWRCKKEVPMLDEHEWQDVYPHIAGGLEAVKAYRLEHGATLTEAKEHHFGQGALDRYFAITGYRETDVQELWHHQLARLGPCCTACGKPLRTPTANFCAECGAPKTRGNE